VNVVVTDDSLPGFPTPYEVGDLAAGDCVTLTTGEIPALEFTDLCEQYAEFVNIAKATGEGAISGQIVEDLDPECVKCEEIIPGACRMTGGNATVSPAIGTDGLDTWTYVKQSETKGSTASGFWISTGGQINAPSGNQPPSGHWNHEQHGGAEGNFGFLSGTSSAPAGTQISTVECADPGWCVQARCAPFKQIFWTGIGNFSHQHFEGVFPECDVLPHGGSEKNGTLHYYKAMVGDFGENDRVTREAALEDDTTDACDWFSKLPGGVPPGPFDASEAVFLDSIPDDQFGDKGGQVCDKCPDYYQIEIHCTTESTSDIIYTFEGFLDSGNYQIHPETGEQCPAIPELVPELFETKKGKGPKK
jgi:hypothetical protein